LVIGLTLASNTTFFVVGDYGVVTNLKQANVVFDAMNHVVETAADQIDKAEFILAAGDNIYPAVADAPTQSEFSEMLSLFQRPALSQLPVYAVRGNHDSYFDWQLELQLSLQQS
jgi:DNA repair exonuclease SbcCD nuclease subunit